MAFQGLQEEELKNRIGDAFFSQFDHATIIGKIDFCVTQKQKVKQGTADTISLLWAEAKRGVISDIYKPLVQLILTIGKARTFDSYLPPPFLAAFDAEKIAFLPYKEILPFFSLNDFNWNVAPSDDTTREFGMLHDAVKATIDRSAYIFRYDSHEKELREFIRVHLSENSELIQINKNNFVSIYQRWLAQVQPSIEAEWELLKKNNIIDGDFFLADLLSENNQSIKEALFVLLQDNRYIVDRRINALGLITSSEVFFKDKQKAHAQFWSIYQRPPKEEYWDYIINRRDLLVPQDIRERKGSFFTPKIWVDLSQKYLADVLGENWQDEYYVWDCAAGTGNLLNGLTNKYRIWASTLDQQDVDVMKDRIKNGANLLESHVFQFDFLNDEFTKLPQPLQEIINDEEKRKKLVIYINPPYAEAGNARTRTGASNKSEVAIQSLIWSLHHKELGLSIRELFAQFVFRVRTDLNSCKLAIFSTAKYIEGTAFKNFRQHFQAQFCGGFVIPADTFNNVRGSFPIIFAIWDLATPAPIISCRFDVPEGMAKESYKTFCANSSARITDWITRFIGIEDEKQIIGYTGNHGPDFQNNLMLQITFFRKIHKNQTLSNATKYPIVIANLIPIVVYFSVRLCIAPTWLNNRDQFYYPNDGWQSDSEFQKNCLAFTLFHGQNRITSTEGTNHWIPFTEAEVDAKEEFKSHFMTDFISGKLGNSNNTAAGGQPAVKINVEATPPQDTNKTSLFSEEKKTSFIPTVPLQFSPKATAVFDAGRELWRYYHAQPNANPNASYYDIRAHFQGRNEKGKMNPKSEDKEYMRLLGNLKEAMELLRLQIVPKVYEYGFLIE